MSNDSGLSLNTEKHFLGKLCNHGHEWGNSGQSVRLKSGGHNCCECKKKHIRKWRKENPEAVKKQTERSVVRISERRRLDPAFRQKLNAACQKWYQENKDVHNAELRFNQENKNVRNAKLRFRRATEEGFRIRSCAYCHDRRTRLKANHSVKFARSEVSIHFASFGDDCGYCGKTCKPTLDHFIPLSRGGSNCLSNLVPACRECNSSKRANDPKEWFQEQPFYDAKRWKAILKALGKTEKTYSQVPLF